MNSERSFKKYIAQEFTAEETLQRSLDFHQFMEERRTIREFSDRGVPKAIIDQIIMTASSAPSGAHKQPWTFCAIADQTIKSRIRKAAEEEEYRNYHGRMPESWVSELEPFGTDWNKPFIETAPWIIVVFRRIYEVIEGKKANNYYVMESVGIATGFLLSAIHNAGLVALTHTPSPMNFLAEILERPENEKPFLLIPVGYPAQDANVPDIVRKDLHQVSKFY